MTDIKLLARINFLGTLMESVFFHQYVNRKEAFEHFMDDLDARFRFDLQAPGTTTAEDADWLQELQSELLQEADRFRAKVLQSISRAKNAE